MLKAGDDDTWILRNGNEDMEVEVLGKENMQVKNGT
jgi:hypothetical protein